MTRMSLTALAIACAAIVVATLAVIVHELALVIAAGVSHAIITSECSGSLTERISAGLVLAYLNYITEVQPWYVS